MRRSSNQRRIDQENRRVEKQLAKSQRVVSLPRVTQPNLTFQQEVMFNIMGGGQNPDGRIWGTVEGCLPQIHGDIWMGGSQTGNLFGMRNREVIYY